MARALLYSIVIVAVVYLCAVYYVRVCGRQLFMSAPSCFMVTQLLFLVGTIIAMDWGEGADRLWILSIVLGLWSFTIGALVANRHFGFAAASEIPAFVARPIKDDIQRAKYSIYVVGLAIFCVAVGVVFSRAVGYNVFGTALGGLIRGQPISAAKYSTLRTSISTEKYVAVGYAVQFTAILLPACLYLIYMRMSRTRRAADRVLFGVLLLLDLYFLTITGGRGWLLHFLVTFILLTSRRFGPLPRGKRQSVFSKSMALVAFVSFYGFATTLMGRVSNTGQGLGSSIGGLIEDFYDRIVGFQTRGHLLIMRHLLERPPAWGAEWWEGLVSVVPGTGKSSGFSSDLHGFLFHGNKSGSVGLTLWGSLLYNWGPIGVLVIAFALGVLMQAYTIRFVRGDRSMARVVLLFVAGYRLSSVRDPYSLLLEGFVSTMILYFLMQRVGRRNSVGATPTRRTGTPSHESIPEMATEPFPRQIARQYGGSPWTA